MQWYHDGSAPMAACRGELLLPLMELNISHRWFSSVFAVDSGARWLVDCHLSLWPGDVESALACFRHSCAIISKVLLRRSRDERQASGDLSAFLGKIVHLLTLRGLPGDSDEVVTCLQQRLKLSERFLELASRSLSAVSVVSLNCSLLGDFFADRNLPGDWTNAYYYYRRSLRLCERMWITNRGMNESVACAREQMGEFLALRRQPGDAEKAFEHYQRSLELREELAKTSPGSPLVARDLALCLQRFARFIADPGLSGDESLANESLSGCFQVLEQMLRHGAELDPPVLQFHSRLKAIVNPLP